ncbi:transposase [Streptomyces sp. NPDC003710]
MSTRTQLSPRPGGGQACGRQPYRESLHPGSANAVCDEGKAIVPIRQRMANLRGEQKNGLRGDTDRDAILYVNGIGVPWEYVPHDFPPYKTVHDFYAKWEADRTTQRAHDLLRDKTRRTHGRSRPQHGTVRSRRELPAAGG